MVTNQYPHFLYVLRTSEAVQNSVGDWETTAPYWELCGRCREETSGRGTVVSDVTYKEIVTTSVLQCSKDCKYVREGLTVIATTREIEPDITSDELALLKEDGTVRVYGTCKKYDRTSFHNRLWL